VEIRKVRLSGCSNGPFLFRSPHPPNLEDASVTKSKSKSKSKSKTKTGKGQRIKPRTNVFVERAKALQATAVPSVRLLDKPTVMAVANVSFVTLWMWMRDGKFPRSRIVGGRSMWRSNEIDAWLNDLPLRPLKGDAPTDIDEAA
jgi:predicted DNA-binding transcriptional regulator AlpA